MAFESNERPSKPITKFESMLKTDDVYFFDAEDFEDIIHHYLNHGKISLAKKAIQLGLQQHPNSIELKLLDVEVLVFENQLDVAEQLLDDLQIIDSANEEIFIQRANIFSKKDDHESAIELLQHALKLSDDSFDIHSLLGMEYLFLDDYEKAKNSFIQCVLYDEQDYSSLYNVIFCFEYLEDYSGAIYYLNEYLDRNPYSDVAWHQLGKMYTSKKMYTEALTAFDFAIIADESFMGAYFEKGRVLEKLEKFEEAIENYQTTISMNDPTAQAYLSIGKCYENLANNEMAKYYYFQTVHEDPLLDKGWLSITNFYSKIGDHKKALFYINKALNIDGENADYWKKYAQINTTLKNYDQADYAYKQTIELGENDAIIWLKWAKVTQLNNDIKGAIQVLQQGIESYPENATFLYKLAGLQLQLNDKISARNTLNLALRKNMDKLYIFEEEFEEYMELEWVIALIKKVKATS